MLNRKFKPSLTGKHIAHIISLCRAEKSEDSISVVLVLFQVVGHHDYLGDIPALTAEERELLNKQFTAERKRGA